MVYGCVFFTHFYFSISVYLYDVFMFFFFNNYPLGTNKVTDGLTDIGQT